MNAKLVLSKKAKIIVGSVIGVIVFVAIIVGILIGTNVIKTKDTEAAPAPAPSPAPAAPSPPAPIPAVVPGSVVVPAVVPDSAVVPATVQTPASSPTAEYVDRGFWNDGGYLHGESEGWNRFEIYNRAIVGPEGFAYDFTETAGETDTDKFNFAKDLAVKLNYDTFGFQNGDIWFGNYMNTFEGVVSKYDKYGPATSNNYPFTGGYLVNHVFSKVPPYSNKTNASNFVDRGCWKDNYTFDYGRTISKTWINMNKTGLPQNEWKKYALDKATEGGYDTFGFQAGVALFLGNYNSIYKYDKVGPVDLETLRLNFDRFAAPLEICPEFGADMINRVYSTVNPA